MTEYNIQFLEQSVGCSEKLAAALGYAEQFDATLDHKDYIITWGLAYAISHALDLDPDDLVAGDDGCYGILVRCAELYAVENELHRPMTQRRVA